MKKSIFTVCAVFLISSFSIAQNGAFNFEDKLLNIGIGIKSYYGGGIPLGASFEYGLTDDISVGANIDYLSTKYNGYKFSAFYFGLRASYHFNELLEINKDNVDVYGGLTIGYRKFSWVNNVYEGTLGKSYESGVYLGALVGGKYYFSDNMGAFAELVAGGATNARLGLAFKL